MSPQNSDIPEQRLDDTGPNPLCVQHGEQIREVRGDVKELKASSLAKTATLQDLRERLIRVETRLEFISTQVTKQTDKASEAFFRYGWPIFLVIITALVSHYAKR